MAITLSATSLPISAADHHPLPLTVGVLGSGHAGTALAAWFASRHVPTALWAPADHPGSISAIKASEGVITTEGMINGPFRVSACDDLAAVIRSSRVLIIVTRADVHDSFVNELANFNGELATKDIVVVCGHGFSIKYERQLRFKRIFETDNSPITSKLSDQKKCNVNIKEMKASFGLSCFPIHRDDAGVIDLPEDTKNIFAQLFSARIICIPPLQVLFFSNYITHAVPAVMNIGRLRDPANSLTKRAEKWLLELDERTPRAEKGFFFYGEGSNTYVCNVQEQIDHERRKVAAACGLRLNSLLQECNDEYDTDYETLREYCLAPSPHNVHHACPDNMEHRYFSEELCSLEDVAAIAAIAKIEIPLTHAFINIIHAGKGKINPTGKSSSVIGNFSSSDLIRFGATNVFNKDEMVE
ncbi:MULTISPECIES: D-nopaline dehydrogenase [Agrobacterium]|uniref:D-nopaline dehydrogenase n=2 Tax=Agrobacterium TaxID=357 RepID=A0A2Z2PPT3_AGRTU|nr:MULTISPECIES: NAD/NADP-dependent octopine/nopaline dehydrogenase family protein [Agrobacterium]ASK44643.1 D-nopaline dehydrogenase [Agrobacterium tumefaciens]WHA44216.1 NAD/NADP octopine/nopaline dehydrogenase family protein [Agrobacterium larrymoorei]